MSTPNWKKLWDSFHLATAAPPSERADLIDRLCGEDLALRSELASLLAAHNQSHAILDTPVAPPEPESFQPPSTVGPYRIERKIGHGGMGDVYLARRADDQFRQCLAIKFATFARYSPALLSRFIAERQILSDLNHRHIARLLDGGTTDEGVPYLAMEYIEGQPVNVYCDAQRLNLEQRLTLFSKICVAVDFAHRNLVVHRDIKPDNILVDRNGEPKLLDFGVAKLLHAEAGKSEATALYGTMATPNFASPEQLRGDNVTTATDVYSLGILLFMLLTGGLPYRIDDQTLGRALARLERNPVRRPSDSIARDSVIARIETRLKRKLSGDLDQIILQALRPEAERRYQSVYAFSEDISRHLSGLPVTARPDRVAYRLGKFVVRHPLGVTAAALLLGMLSTFAWVTARQAAHLERALTQAHSEQQKATQVTQFLKDLFQVSDPLISDNTQVTAGDLLERGRQRLDRELQDQPAVRADLQIVLGTIYGNLDRFDTAESLLRDGIALQQGTHGAGNALNVAAAAELGRVLARQSRYEEAKSVLREALVHAHALRPTPYALIAQIEIRLGRVLQSLAALEEAETLIRSGLDNAQRVPIGGDALVAEASRLLGGILWRQARYAEAEAPFQHALTTNIALYGEQHHETLQAKIAIATLHMRLGHWQQAEPYYLDVISTRLAKLGQDHTLTAAAQNYLGVLYFEMGRLDEALVQLRAARATRTSLLGPDSTELANTLNNLGLTNHQLRHLDEAEALFREALAIQQKVYGQRHFHTGSSMNNLAIVLFDQQRFGEALALFTKAHDVLLEVHGQGHPALAFSETNIARCLLAQGELQAARIWLDQALALRRERLVAGHPALADTLHTYGELLLAQGDYAQAETMLKEALDIRLIKLKSGDWRTGETRNLYGTALAARNTASALPTMRQGLLEMTTVLGPDDWRTRAAQRRVTAAQENRQRG